jgi:hypothetical protein
METSPAISLFLKKKLRAFSITISFEPDIQAPKGRKRTTIFLALLDFEGLVYVSYDRKSKIRL